MCNYDGDHPQRVVAWNNSPGEDYNRPQKNAFCLLITMTFQKNVWKTNQRHPHCCSIILHLDHSWVAWELDREECEECRRRRGFDHLWPMTFGLITYDLWPMVWSPTTYGLITYDLWFDHLWPRSSAAAVAESWWWPSLPADNEYGNDQILMLPKGWEMEAGPLSINVRNVPQPQNTWH